MKYIVLSDTHGNKKGVDMLFASVVCDGVIFAGDGIRDLDDVEKEKFMVRGNCDFFSPEEEIAIFEIEGTKILLTHGHILNVKYALTKLLTLAKENAVDLVIYGHTHRQSMEVIDGITFLNPGSFSRSLFHKSAYAIVDFNNNEFLINMAQF